jgi:dipeptidyl aminopeptidase/acylaminoacyl peptidase
VIGYSYAEEKRHTVYFDEEYKTLQASLSKALKSPSIDFVSTSSDGTKVLLFAGSDTDPGRYYLYDKPKKSIGEVLADRPQLAGRQFAPMKAVTYKAADGTSVPAYLTLPVGKPGKGLPAIVLPHGGPSARDEWGFDWMAQFFAARGYVVIQPNYRGSAGYGDRWLNENGFKGWRTSIGDVNAAARYLAGTGIADPNRIAIVGWSYGGYAALQAAGTEPGLYKAVAAIAPVTDLAMLKRDSANFTNKREVSKFIGDGPHVVEGSPVNVASQIRVPVVLVHGDLDNNVFIGHSDKMAAQLRKAGVPVEYLRYEGLDHQLASGEVRAQMLVKLAAHLSKTIGD